MNRIKCKYQPQSCILFATADWDEPYWTNKQHSAKSLADLGIKVLYIESVGLRTPKASSGKDWGRLWNRLIKGLKSLIFGAKERAPGIYVLSPLLVPAGYRFKVTRTLNYLLLRIFLIRSIRQRHLVKPLVWTYHPFMLDAIDGLNIGPILYHCVDDHSAVPGIDAPRFRSAEEKLLRRADVVFATAPYLDEYCRRFNPNTHFLPNVVDAEHFGRALESSPIPEDLAGIPEPRLCYHGVLSDFKIDFQLLIDMARLKPEWSFVLIGEEREGQKSPLVAELAKLPNVHFLGYKPYSSLPDYLRGMRVGLLPSLINDYTRGMFPMKYYEYLAAGLPVVSTPLDFTRVCSHGLLHGVTAGEFVTSIGRQLTKGLLTPIEAKAYVGSNTWRTRCQLMLGKLN